MTLRQIEDKALKAQIDANELGSKSERTEEEETKLTEVRGEVVKLQKAVLEARAKEDKTTERTVEGPERTEYRRLLDGAKISDFMGAVLGGRLEGESRELGEHHKLGLGKFPTELIRALATEKRAATAAPADGPVTRMPTMDYVFPRSAATHLGIPQPIVPSGSALFPRISSKATGYKVAEGTAVSQSEATFTGTEIGPSRLQSAVYFSREDAARFPNFEDDLRAHLRRTLADQMDQSVINATTIGLVNALTQVDAGADEFTYEKHIAGLALDRIDGRYAVALADLRLVLGAATFAHAGQKRYVSGSASGGESALSFLSDKTGGLMVSANLPAKASDKEKNIVARGTEHRGAAFPIWQASEILLDPYSRSDTGEVQLTIVLLGNFKVLDASAFALIETKVA